jgi:hypothetical protein
MGVHGVLWEHTGGHWVNVGRIEGEKPWEIGEGPSESVGISQAPPVALNYNPSYLGGWDQEDGGSRPTPGK